MREPPTRDELEDMMADLQEKEKGLLRYIMGYDDGNTHTLQEARDYLFPDLPEPRVRAMYCNAVLKLEERLRLEDKL